MLYKLIKNSVVLKVGDDVTTFRGESAKITAISSPGLESNGGRVYLKIGDLAPFPYFPSVIDAVFVEAAACL